MRTSELRAISLGFRPRRSMSAIQLLVGLRLLEFVMSGKSPTVNG